ncbi:MAG TPA: hypothetical protein VMQ17_03340 [Candidatus Sulfotelmatobacter sp.]|nr:hypothetical protein [Candidatus Sulfotelmatobacter sp.]
MHDIYYGQEPPPNRKPIPLVRPGDRIGKPYFRVPAEKIAGIVLTDTPDRNSAFKPPDEASKRIAGHILEFLRWEVKKGANAGEPSAPAIGRGQYSECPVWAGGRSV